MSLKQAFILATAMPPTKGHRDLINFANSLVDCSMVHVIVCTQPHEPMVNERWEAVVRAFSDQSVQVHSYREAAPQFPTGTVQEINDFWGYWTGVLKRYGFEQGDYIVSSEMYGIELAERSGGTFMPYDLNRDVNGCRATYIREDPYHYFNDILPEFQSNLIKTVTFFGAESCGKTTLSKECARRLDGHYLPEWARPYLEAVGPEVTDEKMHAIWRGQAALQAVGQHLGGKRFVIQDTDLYSTLGYWEMYSPNTVPHGLLWQCGRTKSDLYLICSSSIPFEPDSLRYGGDQRETTDDYWIELCKKHGLNYRVIEPSWHESRLSLAISHIKEEFNKTAYDLTFEREKESSNDC